MLKFSRCILSALILIVFLYKRVYSYNQLLDIVINVFCYLNDYIRSNRFNVFFFQGLGNFKLEIATQN